MRTHLAYRLALIALVAALLMTAVGCMSSSEVRNDSHDRDNAGGIDARVGSLDVHPPAAPVPEKKEDPDLFAARLAAWERAIDKITAALATVKLPETITGITIHDLQVWKDQAGTGGAETRAKGEAAADANVAAGGGTASKEGGSTDNSSDTETRTEERTAETGGEGGTETETQGG